MIDLRQHWEATPRVQTVAADPGRVWRKDPACAVEAPPDDDPVPQPEARWPARAARTGVGGAVSPRVVALPGGIFRLFYTQILPRPGFPHGALDYENATTRILSACSHDGVAWHPEPGVRLSARDGGAGEFRVVSSEVVPAPGAAGRLRMYYECCPGTQAETNSIRSAISDDGGHEWTPEPGVRLARAGANLMAPRILFLADGRLRLFCAERGRGIISAVSRDGGLAFAEEPGVRIDQDGPFDAAAAFAPEVVPVAGGGFLMYYAGYSAADRAQILRAWSADGLAWEKEPAPAIAPGPGPLDAAKCSEMCLLRTGPSGYRMFYEGCDGTARGRRGVWRVLAASSGR